MQFLDPELLGPLFRFNREFYHLNEKGRPIGYRNLEALADRVSSVMLRRRKEDVESQLPGRVDKTFFVPMTDAQTSFYDDYERLAGRLASIAGRRPLRKEEFEQLQRYLACMRMVCDTPYILDDKPYECPKMDELERLLPDLLDDPGCKIIVFSEWVRMLALVRDYALGAGLEFAWHTGSVPQQRRRAEIRRFREDPDCRLFLSSESGGVGLNLQAANVVVNLDQPWNPARAGAGGPGEAQAQGGGAARRRRLPGGSPRAGGGSGPARHRRNGGAAWRAGARRRGFRRRVPAAGGT